MTISIFSNNSNNIKLNFLRTGFMKCVCMCMMPEKKSSKQRHITQNHASMATVCNIVTEAQEYTHSYIILTSSHVLNLRYKTHYPK